MECEIYGYSLAASEYVQFNNNNGDVLLGHEIYMPQQKNGVAEGGIQGLCVLDKLNQGNVMAGTSAHSSSTLQGHVVEKKKRQCKHSTTKLSVDPQSVAARHRRHRISKRFRILQTLVPGGTKMDTASMLDEAIQYVKFLKYQIWFHEMMGYVFNGSNNNNTNNSDCVSLSSSSGQGISPLAQINSGGYNLYALSEGNACNYTSGN